MPFTFDLPNRLRAKAAPELVVDDESHFARIARSLEEQKTQLQTRLDAARARPAGTGQSAMDRDTEVHRLSARLRTLSRYSLDLCLGRMVTDSGDTVYIGRLGLLDASDERLLVDWRSPAAEPFFAATHQDPRGLVSRRRYRWEGGRVIDYWDEVYVGTDEANPAALDDQSAFIASLGASRSAQMRDVLGTIAADQDAIVRAPARGALVVDGGPGTGKTVVALHRTAYLLYADAQVGRRAGGVLVVGPHAPYLAYVADVLPSLGEEGVRTCTLREMVPGAEAFPDEPEPDVAKLKADVRMVAAIEPAVAFYEEAPTEGMEIALPEGTVRVSPGDWAEAIASVEPGTPHNDARDRVWSALLEILADKRVSDGEGQDPLDAWGDEGGEGVEDEGEAEFDAYGLDRDDGAADRRALESSAELADAFGRVWPRLRAQDVVGDLWEVPAYLRRCAPWLTPSEAAKLRRRRSHAWTTADLPLLDAARRRLGDPDAWRRRQRQQAEARAEARDRADVTAQLIATDDSELHVMSMLRGQDLRHALQADVALSDADPLAGPFAHIVVDEAQELTDAEWQMLLSRCPQGNLTIVGDRAQARHGFTESWTDRLARVGLSRVAVRTLSVNYRTPSEVMAEAEPVIRAAIPNVTVPTSIRASGVPVTHASVDELDDLLAGWLAEHEEGTACTISTRLGQEETHGRVRRLRPEHAKGLEFDLVVLVDPDTFGGGITGAVDRYVAMTRATQQLVVLRS
ncbi:RNA polymerase recycling motor ATPase HelR [Miniimonas sp. S16]|uniref:RNA polymerase recycling motor ATPase HelR n=1 Tax=Miniimonas sp. S16 TaxID=2171623 RepID=UPI000D52813E|nr:RNA polymerase recycling motor ATPase HelR [Miniimonas sp. S16]